MMRNWLMYIFAQYKIFMFSLSPTYKEVWRIQTSHNPCRHSSWCDQILVSMFNSHTWIQFRVCYIFAKSKRRKNESVYRMKILFIDSRKLYHHYCQFFFLLSLSPSLSFLILSKDNWPQNRFTIDNK